MKKLLLVIFATLSLSATTYAQDIEKNDNVIYLGFGLDPYWSPYRKNVGPIVLGYERIITDVIGIGRFGVGGLVGQSFYGDGYGRTTILAKAAYHFDFNVTGLDFYAGAGLGLNFYNWDNHPGYRRTPLGHHVYAGIRYFFTDNFGLWAELGYGYSAFNGGVAFKF